MNHPDLERRTEALAARLAASGHWVSPDGRVTEATAAEVIGVTSRTMARWREAGVAPPFYRAGRLTYALRDVLAFLDRQCSTSLAS